jgi:hypothetical protein
VSQVVSGDLRHLPVELLVTLLAVAAAALPPLRVRLSTSARFASRTKASSSTGTAGRASSAKALSSYPGYHGWSAVSGAHNRRTWSAVWP